MFIFYARACEASQRVKSLKNVYQYNRVSIPNLFFIFFFWEEHTPPHFNLPSALKYVFNLKCFEKSHMLYNITSVRSYFFFIRHQKLTI